MRKHAQAPLFICPVEGCQSTFTEKNNCFKHMQTLHVSHINLKSMTIGSPEYKLAWQELARQDSLSKQAVDLLLKQSKDQVSEFSTSWVSETISEAKDS